MSRDKDRLKKELRDSEVTFRGSAPVQKRGAFERVVDLFKPKPETKIWIMEGFEHSRRYAAGIAIAAAVTAISTSALLDQTHTAMLDLQTNPSPTAPYQAPVKSASELIFDIIQNVVEEKDRIEKQNEVATNIGQMNNDIQFTPHVMVESPPWEKDYQRIKQGEDMIFGKIALSVEELIEYKDKVAADPLQKSNVKGDSLG